MIGLCFNLPHSIFYNEYRRQLFATLTLNIISFSHGIVLGWVAPMLYRLKSPDSPLEFRISIQEISWIGSMICFGGLTGILVFGCLIDQIGRKLCLYLVAVPQICLWIAVFFASNVYYLYLARIFGGMSGGGSLVLIPIYISEIADNKIRGALTSSFTLSRNIGILSSFIICSRAPYHSIPWVAIALPILYLFLWILYPETPQYLLRKGRIDEAESSYKFYKNYKLTTVENFEKLTTEFAELKAVMQTISHKVTIRDICNKQALKAIGSGLVLLFVSIYSGAFAIINYSSIIFAETGSKMDPHTNTIIIGAVQLLGSCCALNLVDRYGRKVLLLVSTCGMFLGLSTLGTYTYLAVEMHLGSVTWLPVVSISLVIFSASIGTGPITTLVIIEILPPKIRSLGATTCLSSLPIFVFIILKNYLILMDMFGLPAIMWICASVASFGFFFVLLCIPETKGKSLNVDREHD